MLQSVTTWCSVMQYVAVCCRVLPCVAVCCSVLQCVAVCCSVLQCVAVFGSVLQCVYQILNTQHHITGKHFLLLLFFLLFQYEYHPSLHPIHLKIRWAYMCTDVLNMYICTYIYFIYMYTYIHIHTSLSACRAQRIDRVATNLE